MSGDGVEVVCWGLSRGLIRFACYGWPENLIAAGIATREMLLPKAQGRPARDQNGQRFTVSRYWRLRDDTPQHHYKLSRKIRPDSLASMPGGLDAISNYIRAQSRNREYSEKHYPRFWVETEAELRSLSRAVMPTTLKALINDLAV